MIITDNSQLQKYKGKYVVYLLTSPSGKQYCGYSSNIKRRWHSISEYKDCTVIYNALKKYGFDNFKKEILYSFDSSEEALKKEKETIEELKLLNPSIGYNLVPGGGDPPHGINQHLSLEQKEKQRIRGKQLAEDIWKNPEKAEYVKKRMKEEVHKSRMAMTPEQRKQSFGSHNLGKTPHNAKKILQIDLQTKEVLNEYESSRQAALALNLDAEASSNIRRTANGKGKQAYGFGWRWKDDNDKY